VLRPQRSRRDAFAEDPSFGPDPLGLVDFDAGRGGAYTSLGCAASVIGLVAVGVGVLLWSVAAIGTLFQGGNRRLPRATSRPTSWCALPISATRRRSVPYLAGADPNDGGEIGQVPFDIAIKAVAERNPTDRLSGLDTAVMIFPGNLPPLVAAATNGDALMVDRLLLAGVDPNRIGFDRFAPLHGAVLGGDIDIVKRLLDAGAVTTPVLPAGAPSPVELATTTGQPDIVAVLAAAGPK